MTTMAAFVSSTRRKKWYHTLADLEHNPPQRKTPAPPTLSHPQRRALQLAYEHGSVSTAGSVSAATRTLVSLERRGLLTTADRQTYILTQAGCAKIEEQTFHEGE